MKITLKNLGPLIQTEFELGNLTIICGKNNTGKTYATYATYGFIDYWNKSYTINFEKATIELLLANGQVPLDLQLYEKRAPQIIADAGKKYSAILNHVFASKESLFKGVSFKAEIAIKENDYLDKRIKVQAGSAERTILQITKEPGSKVLLVSLMMERDKNVEMPATQMIASIISDALKEVLFASHIPRVFIASAERTGAAIFQKELDFTRNRLVELLGDKGSGLHPLKLLDRFSSEYPIPVRRNVDFIRELPSVFNKDSPLYKQYPDMIADFSEIIGGEYKVARNGDIQYIPDANKRLRLSMVESSSAVRSLLDIGFYLRHKATPGDMLMVDEPELNLHPENQRRIARLFACLVNVGIKVFITTHSDYIIRELNTLIMLNKKSEYSQTVADEEGYHEKEFLSKAQLKVYVAQDDLILKKGNKRKTQCKSLVSADIDPDIGIEVQSFDTTIDDMNRIQESLIWGED